MKKEKLYVIYPQKRGNHGRERLDQVLNYALDGMDVEIFEDMDVLWEEGGEHEGIAGHGTARFRGCKILFAVPLGKDGVNRGY